MNLLRESLSANAGWFIDSGVMLPCDGSWGVAERVLLTKNNPALNQVYTEFPAWTPHDEAGYSIIEPRRADCCFEAAFLFQQLSTVFDEPHYGKIAENILEFLYRRSGLLTYKGDHPSIWHWSHISGRASYWFDDNAWVCILQLMIGKANPEWDRKYQMTDWALKLADELAGGFFAQFRQKTQEGVLWSGNLDLPHWGSLVVMALARAYQTTPKEPYRELATAYHRYLKEHHADFTTSEFGYAVLGATMAHKVFGDELSLEIAILFADKILKRMDPETGCIPSEHYEAPSGTCLADTIYTVNWAFLALQNMVALVDEKKYRDGFEQILALLLRIQDRTPEKHLHGCWRGMYDLAANSWGGGDRYELREREASIPDGQTLPLPSGSSIASTTNHYWISKHGFQTCHQTLRTGADRAGHPVLGKPLRRSRTRRLFHLA